MGHKFSESWLSKLEPKEKVFTMQDLGCAYLYVRVQKSGRKVLYVKFRANGKVHRKDLGLVGAISLFEARKVAGQFRMEGYIPKEEPEIDDFEKPRVSQLISEFKTGHFPNIKLSTSQDYERHLKWLDKRCGHLDIDQIDRSMARRLKKEYSDGATGNRFLATVRKCWSWGIKAGVVDGDNPFMAVEKEKEVSREVRVDENQLKAIIREAKMEPPIHKAFFLLCIFTCCRRGEAEKMRWRDIDGDIWEKPDTKNKKGQRIAIPSDVLEALNDLKEPWMGPDDYVFNGKQIARKAWDRVKARANVPSELRVHDLRRSVATMLLTSGKATIGQISLMLGHSDVAITMKVYARYLGDNREAVNAVSDLLK